MTASHSSVALHCQGGLQWTVELGPLVLGMVPKDGPGTAVHSCGACWWAGLLTTASKEDTPPWKECKYSERRYFCNTLAMNGARHAWRRAQKILLQRTNSKSQIGELAPMALCDIHVAGCGEHLPAWGLRDDRILGTDHAVRGGRHGQKLYSGFPPKQVDARSSADARSIRMPACHSRRFKGERPIGAATG